MELLTQYGSKFTVVEERVHSDRAERLTLDHVKELTRPTDRIFYLHSKGAPFVTLMISVQEGDAAAPCTRVVLTQSKGGVGV